MFNIIRRTARVFVLIAAAVASPAQAQNACAPASEWTIPGSGRVAAQEILSRAAAMSVVLLGESHDDADHHRWQLNTIAGLAALRPRLALGFEMFPRRVQGALDRWVAGELDEAAFLKAADWSSFWRFDAALYMPLFQFARLNRVPMIALNVEHSFVSEVGAKGLESVPLSRREGVTDPVPASEAYLKKLFAAFGEHPEKGGTLARSDPAFGRFVQAQLVWDRAMAQALAEAAAPGRLVVGVMGSGHIAGGDGVPHQLRSLGMTRIASLLPWDRDADCKTFSPGLATAVFGIPAARPAPSRPLLGITIRRTPEGVGIVAVRADSIAQAAGLRAGDILIEAAGLAIKAAGDVRPIVESMAPGTWLPLKVRRQGDTIELTAKFPPAK